MMFLCNSQVAGAQPGDAAKLALVSERDAAAQARALRVNVAAVGGLQWWRYAMAVELEHGTALGRADTNVTGTRLDATARIALAHVREFPDYCQRLHRMEQEAEAHWRDRVKPAVLTE